MVRGFLYCYINKGKNRLITKEYSQRVGESPGQYGLTAFGRCRRTRFLLWPRIGDRGVRGATVGGRACSFAHGFWSVLGASPFDGNVLFRERFRRTGLGAPTVGECFDGTALFDTADGLVNEFTSKKFFKKEFQL